MIVCERYALLPNDKKQMIAGELDRSVREIERKISVGSSRTTTVFMTGTNLITGYADSSGVLAIPLIESTMEGKKWLDLCMFLRNIQCLVQ